MDRRFILAMALMTLIIVAPSILFKQPPPPPRPAPVDTTVAPDTQVPTGPVTPLPPATAVPPPPADLPPEDTVLVESPLYRYGISTRGGRLVVASLTKYRSMARETRGEEAQIIEDGSHVLAPRLLVGRDTLRLDDWTFVPSAARLQVEEPSELTLRAQRGGVVVEVTYAFTPEDYRIRVRGVVTGIGPNGGLLLFGMGPGLRNTEEDRRENQQEMGFVTKQAGTSLTRFSSLEPGQTETVSGPFEWVAVKSKYFVVGILTTETERRLSGLTATPPAQPAGEDPVRANIWVSLPVSADGLFQYLVYAGPMEYPRLAGLGHDFDDVNPYGWPGFRTIIRPVAVAVRWLLVWMHENLNLAYGWVLVTFGILVRVVLWPLNQKAMRASIRMQAVQPLMKEIQDRHKGDPQKLQQEMFKLYKEHNVNPFGGCWPMLLPMPVLFALFFVFLNTIELRGVTFFWLPDLSRPDPLYIIPVVMGLSMYVLSKVGQIGIAPNPQMKLMLYVMPVMMTVLFLNFASGLNLYYAVSNIASIPQQWLIAHERQKAAPPTPAASQAKS